MVNKTNLSKQTFYFLSLSFLFYFKSYSIRQGSNPSIIQSSGWGLGHAGKVNKCPLLNLFP